MARPGLTGHRKFRRLSRALGSSIVARGALELLWEHCYESGEEYVGLAEDIESMVGWEGERGMLTRALADAGAPEGSGFIEPVDTSEPARYRVHDLWHHAPDYVIKRRKRELDRQSRSAPNGGQRPPSLDWQLGDVRPPSPSHSPSPAAKSISSEPTNGSKPSTFLEFPTVGSGGSSWALTETLVDEFAELYPTVDVRQEARAALGWVRSSPGRRKTGGGMRRFLNSWLTRAVNRGGGRGMTSPAATSQPVERWSCPHVERCGSRSICANATFLGRPVKAAAS